MEYWEKDRVQAIRSFAPFLNLTPEDYASMVQGIVFIDRTENNRYFGSRDTRSLVYEDLRQCASLWHKNQIISKLPPVEDLISWKGIQNE
jgi:hypothetical protein